MRCKYRNAICSFNNRPCVYGTITVDALAVSWDAFFYRVGAELFLAPGTPGSRTSTLFGFGEKSGIELPFEFDGRIPTDALKARLAEQDAISDKEGEGFYVGDAVQMAIGQGLTATTPLQLAIAYATIANGGFLLKPTSSRRSTSRAYRTARCRASPTSPPACRSRS